ncbi:MAG: SWIM zinc finger family protein [Bacteroidales bacterium]
MPKYGQTWWGGEWMKALSHIDYSNRLPRGRNYANKGAVREITLKSKTIKALVQGTRSTPYKVTVKTPGFTAAEKTTMTSAILENPLLLTRLLNRDLPPQLHQIAAKSNIRIFPRRWDDLQMNCSCPDWAVPCKHLAAVINVIANEIDRNPFLLFRFHDFDIVDELSKHELDASNISGGIFNMAQIYTEVATENDKPGHDSTATTGTGKQDKKSAAVFADLDFSAIENMRETILSLLPEKPLFYSGDFKAVTEKLYKKVSKSVTRQLEMADEGDRNGINYEKFNEVQINFREDIFFSSCRLLSLHLSGEESVTFTTGWDLILFLSEIPPKFSGRLQGYLAFLYFMLLFARRLAEQSAFIPQIVRLTNGSYTVRWIPA